MLKRIKSTIKPILFSFYVCLFVSCYPLPDNVVEVLELSGNNQKELKKVIDHYKKYKNRKQYKAALFLIGNMKDKYGIYYPEDAAFFDILSKIDSLKKNNISEKKINDFIDEELKINKGQYENSSLGKVMDYNIITADFLINNIDKAFMVWETKPWAKHVTFEEFCEWILPYRVNEEPLQYWREFMYNKYIHYEDSIKNKESPKEICEFINLKLAEPFHFSDKLNFVPYLGGIDQHRFKSGLCKHRYQLIVMVMRSLGIPVRIDQTPRYCKETTKHAWTTLLDKDSILPFNGGETWAKLLNPAKCPLAGDGYVPVTTVFRNRFEINKKSLSFHEEVKDIPPFFQNNYLENVSDEYTGNIQGTIELKIKGREIQDGELVYLFVIGPGTILTPVAYTRSKRNKAVFKNMGRDCIYISGTYNMDKINLLTEPFIFPSDIKGQIEYITMETNKYDNIRLYRKFYPKYFMRTYSEGMIGAKIQGSDFKDFREFQTLFEIDTATYDFREYKIGTDKSSRYYRYLSNDSVDIHIAEINLFYTNKSNNKTQVAGDVYGFNSDLDTEEDVVFDNAFDNDIRTNFNAPKKSWVAVDAGKRVSISSIRYMSRNNFNIVEPGDEYQLLYINKNGWHIIDQKKAGDYFIDFKNVPKGCVMVLRNLSRGREESIFRWENNKQKFW